MGDGNGRGHPVNAASMTNRRPTACGHCGAELGAGRGRVWRDRSGRWHCTCLDPSACKARLTPPRTSREELHAAVLRAVEAGALEASVEDLAARARGEVVEEPLFDLVFSPETEASLAAMLPPWPTRHAAASEPPARPVEPPAPSEAPRARRAPRPGDARREWMVCDCGGRAECYSDTLGVQHWQCMTCLAAGRPSCWDTCTTCGHRTDDLVAPWVCPGCGRNRRPAPVPVEGLDGGIVLANHGMSA